MMQLPVSLLLLTTKILLLFPRASLGTQREGDSSGPLTWKRTRSQAASRSRSRVPTGSGSRPGTAAPGQGDVLPQRSSGRLQATAKAAAWEHLHCVRALAGGSRL